MTKLEALREAQLWMLRDRLSERPLHQTEGETSRVTGRRLPPYFWAGFVLSGDLLGRAAGPVER